MATEDIENLLEYESDEETKTTEPGKVATKKK